MDFQSPLCDRAQFKSHKFNVNGAKMAIFCILVSLFQLWRRSNGSHKLLLYWVRHFTCVRQMKSLKCCHFGIQTAEILGHTFLTQCLFCHLHVRVFSELMGVQNEQKIKHKVNYQVRFSGSEISESELTCVDLMSS